MEPVVPAVALPSVVRSPWTADGDIDIQQIAPSMRTGMFRLPPDVGDVTGRDDVLRTIGDLLEPSGDQATAVVVFAVAGLAGVGKTALGHFERAELLPHGVGDQLGLAKALEGAGRALAAKGERRSAAARRNEALAILGNLGASESMKVHAGLDD
jgi:hypothetical protein